MREVEIRESVVRSLTWIGKQMNCMKTFKTMMVAMAPGATLAALWWFISPQTFAGHSFFGMYTSIGIGFVAGLGLIYFVLPDFE